VKWILSRQVILPTRTACSHRKMATFHRLPSALSCRKLILYWSRWLRPLEAHLQVPLPGFEKSGADRLDRIAAQVARENLSIRVD
jgi:hypothetical protein